MPIAAAGAGGRHITELGLLLGVTGGLMVAFGAYVVLRGPRSNDRSLRRAVERSATLVGFLLIGACLGLQLIVQVGRAFK
jgi:hypothetical protein